jgi:RNA polymerase sigma-70 factor (ECF subfamily)
MASDSSFADLIERMRQGDPWAFQRVFEAYFNRLIGLARSRLDPRILAKDGAEDVAQSVLKSFFVRQKEAPYVLHNWDNLWALLAMITLRKCGHRTEHYRAQCRDFTRETPIDRPSTDSDSAASYMALARDPPPSEAAVMEDTLRQLLEGLNDFEREVMQLAFEEHSLAEISRRTNTSEYHLKKVIAKVKKRWEMLA